MSKGHSATSQRRDNEWRASYWRWVVHASIVVFILFLVGGYAVIPLITSSTPPLKHAEAEVILESAKDYFQDEYSQSGKATTAVEALREEIANGNFEGHYFRVSDVIYFGDALGRPKGGDLSEQHVRIVATPFDEDDGWAVLIVVLEGRGGGIEWYDTRPGWLRD